jgi:hypothetical protein
MQSVDDLLRKMSRTAVFRHKGSGQQALDIGRVLGVQAVLIGRVLPLKGCVPLCGAFSASGSSGQSAPRRLAMLMTLYATGGGVMCHRPYASKWGSS